jgi:dipeptidyl aminopeptidase/acylaminoacyl peptidase
MPTAKRAMHREDLLKFQWIRSFDISPDGSRIVYAREWIDAKDNKYYANLWMYDRLRDRHTQFTHGKHKDRSPVFSPGGTQVAFCSSRDKQDGLYLIGTGGGAERAVCRKRGSFGNLSWSPDGTQLLFMYRMPYIEPASDAPEDVKKSEEAPVYRHIKRLWYRLDGDGWRPADGYHIWRYDLVHDQAIQVTHGRYDEEGPVFSPDGKQIAYTTNRRKDPDKDVVFRDIMICDVSGKKERKVAKPDGPASALSYSPDGRYLAYIGHDNPYDAWGATNENLWVVPTAGGKARNLTRKFDTTLSDPCISDMGEAFHGAMPPVWSADSRHLLFTAPRHGSNDIYTIPRAGGSPRLVAGGRWDVQAVRADRRRRVLAMVVSGPKSGGDLWTLELGTGTQAPPTRVTDVNRELFREIQIGLPQQVWFKSYDGTRVHGWILHPPKFNPRRKYPAIVEVHGGPRAMYGWGLFHEMQYLAASGYVVFYTNPRGSQGYGEAFTKAIINNWGGPDYEDVMAGTDALCNLPYVDTARVGVTGGSYGGYMTNWIVGHTQRFKAAVTQRSVVNLVSFFGSSDVGYDIKDEFLATPWEKVEELVRMSPLTYVNKIRTPLLILHNESDLRCGIEQAEELFACLKYLGRTVEFVRFPEEPHGLSRMGRPDRRMARLQFIREWFDRYL